MIVKRNWAVWLGWIVMGVSLSPVRKGFESGQGLKELFPSFNLLLTLLLPDSYRYPSCFRSAKDDSMCGLLLKDLMTIKALKATLLKFREIHPIKESFKSFYILPLLIKI